MAVFTEQEIMKDSSKVESILENALYLSTPIITPKTVAVTENSAVQAMVVRFKDIADLSEQYGYSYLDAMSAVVEANELDPNTFAVAVDEAEIIEHPELMNELANVVINPISDYDPEYQFCEACFNAWLESGDESFLEEFILNEKSKPKKGINLNNMDSNARNSLADQLKAQLGLTGSNSGSSGSLSAPASSVTSNTNSTNSSSSSSSSSLAAPKSSAASTTTNSTTKSSTGSLAAPKSTTSNTSSTSSTKPGSTAASSIKSGGLFSKLNWKHGAAAGAGLAAVGGLAYYANKPDSVIARKIASLRNLGRKVEAQALQNPQKKNVFQKVIAKIKDMIAKLSSMRKGK